MDFHPIANLFPLMEGAEFDALVEDIRVNGLRDSITTYEEKILDGRNRFNACEKAGRKPQFVTLSGEDPYAFVTSKNLRRRNMTFEQRAFVAEAMATLKDGQRKAARPTGLPDASLPDAAKLLGVGVKSERRPPSASRPLLELVRERSVIKVSLDAWEGGGVNVTFAFWTKSSSGRPLCLRRIGIHGDELPRVVAVLRELVPEEAANG